jgi:hypothetical protein
VLLELADSQITYRRRYVMVAAPARHRPRGARSQQSPFDRLQLGRIETHLAVLANDRESPVPGADCGYAGDATTVEAADLDEAAFSAWKTLMRLADVIAHLFTSHERAQTR